VITSSRVEKVMKQVDRGHYSRNNAYSDAPQGIGYGVTISAPHMVITDREQFKINWDKMIATFDLNSFSSMRTP